MGAGCVTPVLWLQPLSPASSPQSALNLSSHICMLQGMPPGPTFILLAGPQLSTPHVESDPQLAM